MRVGPGSSAPLLPRGHHVTSLPQQEGGHVGGRPPGCGGSWDPSLGQPLLLRHTRAQREDATSQDALREDTPKPSRQNQGP